MNLRNDIPEQIDSEDNFRLTFKGWLYLKLQNTNINVDNLLKDLYEFNKKFCKKGEIPAIIFNNLNGSFNGVINK